MTAEIFHGQIKSLGPTTADKVSILLNRKKRKKNPRKGFFSIIQKTKWQKNFISNNNKTKDWALVENTALVGVEVDLG